MPALDALGPVDLAALSLSDDGDSDNPVPSYEKKLIFEIMEGGGSEAD